MVAVVAAVGLLAWSLLRDTDSSALTAIESKVTIMRGELPLLERSVDELEAMGTAGVRRWVRELPPRRRERRGRAVVALRTDYAVLETKVRSLVARGGGMLELPERAVSSSSSLAVTKQKLRNNCEAAALSMMLAADGTRVDQLRLQRELPRSGPLDPRPANANGLTTWGDPREGFVGRPEGGGVAGGYGVYEKPIIGLGRRHRLTLRRVEGRSRTAVYRALLSGRPVMAWVGLSDGPYKTWLTPSGKPFTGNFGEHTVVLVGIKGTRLQVNDPLSGKRLTWTRTQFERMWELLGRQALTTPAA